MPRSIQHIPDRKGLALRLKQRREELGLSQRQLAFPGCTAAYISRLEAAARAPSRQMIDELADRLHTTRAWLETGEGAKDGASSHASIEFAVPDLDAEIVRWLGPPDGDALTWASLDAIEQAAILGAMRDAALRVVGPLANVIAINRKMKQERLEELDLELRERLSAAAELA